jgi:hypothetical protein
LVGDASATSLTCGSDVDIFIWALATGRGEGDMGVFMDPAICLPGADARHIYAAGTNMRPVPMQLFSQPANGEAAPRQHLAGAY